MSSGGRIHKDTDGAQHHAMMGFDRGAWDQAVSLSPRFVRSNFETKIHGTVESLFAASLTFTFPFTCSAALSPSPPSQPSPVVVSVCCASSRVHSVPRGAHNFESLLFSLLSVNKLSSLSTAFAMLYFLRGNTRRSALKSLTGMAPAAASFLGIRVGRSLILRVSSLLALRTLLSAIELPLDAGVVSYVWTFLFASVQASVAIAAAASFLDVGGILGVVARRLFASPGDAAFVKLYGGLVLVVGPMASLVETAVITFEVMRLSRATTDRMFAAESRGEGTLIRKSVFAVVGLCATLSLGIVYVAGSVYPGKVPLIMSTVLIAMYAMCFVAENGHLLETAVLALVAEITLAIGLIEEFDAPTLALDPLIVQKYAGAPKPQVNMFGATYSLQSAETRAVLLMYTTAMLMFAMARAPRFIRLLQVGADRLKSEESASSGRPVVAANGESAVVGEEATSAALPVRTELSGSLRGVYNTVVLMAVTFRFVLWTGEVHNSEYIPAMCRAVQVVAMMILYRVYLGKDDEEPIVTPEPVRDIAGNIIENPIAL